MTFEDKQVQKTLDKLVATKVMSKKEEQYSVNPDFDLIFRGRTIRHLNDGEKGEEAMLDALVDTLAEYEAFEEEGVNLDNQLMVRIVLTFASSETIKLVYGLNKKRVRR